MTVAEIIAIIIAASSLISALSIIYATLIRPVKDVVKDVEKSKEQIPEIMEQFEGLRQSLETHYEFDCESRAVTMKTLIAVLDGLEQVGANHQVTEAKKQLIEYMADNQNLK